MSGVERAFAGVRLLGFGFLADDCSQVQIGFARCLEMITNTLQRVLQRILARRTQHLALDRRGIRRPRKPLSAPRTLPVFTHHEMKKISARDPSLVS